MDFQCNCFKKRQSKTKKTRWKQQQSKPLKWTIFLKLKGYFDCIKDSKYVFLVEMRNAPLFGKVLPFQKLDLTTSWNQWNLSLTCFSFTKTIGSSRLLGVVIECFGYLWIVLDCFLIFSLAVVCCFGLFWDAVDCCGS